MSIDSDIYDILGNVSNRVFPVILPIETILPALTYQRVSTLRYRAHEGDALLGPLYQVTCWDANPKGARALARSVVEEFAPMLGYAQVENQLESYDPGAKLYTVFVDVRVFAAEEEAVS